MNSVLCNLVEAALQKHMHVKCRGTGENSVESRVGRLARMLGAKYGFKK